MLDATIAGRGLDEDGFRAGAADMLAVEMRAPAISAFMNSDRIQVDRADLDLIYRSWGTPFTLPIPVAEA